MNRPTLHIPSDERHRQAALENMHQRVAAKRAAQNGDVEYNSRDAGIEFTASRIRARAGRAGLRATRLSTPSYAVPSSN